MNPYLAEFIGTLLLIVFGTSLNAGMTLKKGLSNGAGWVATAFGWGFAVMIGLYASVPFSGGHLNPAVTIALAVGGDFAWSSVAGYIAAQIAGAFVGAAFTVAHYYPHFKETPKEIHTLGVFSTGPAIKNTPFNFISEVIATFFFLFGFLALANSDVFAGGLLPIAAGFLVAAIGFSFGPTTGYAINPARDLGPRLAYALLPIPNKGHANWGYAWIPILGPITGAVLAIIAFNAFW